jgi:hypothetical protein
MSLQVPLQRACEYNEGRSVARAEPRSRERRADRPGEGRVRAIEQQQQRCRDFELFNDANRDEVQRSELGCWATRCDEGAARLRPQAAALCGKMPSDRIPLIASCL